MELLKEYIQQLDGLEKALLAKLNYQENESLDLQCLFAYQYSNPKDIMVNKVLLNNLNHEQIISELKGLVLRVINNPAFTVKH